MKVAVGCDVYGFPLKLVVNKWLEDNGHSVTDVGCKTYQADEKICDYADSVAHLVASGKVKRGILLCKSGGFMAIRANRHPGVRAIVDNGNLLLRHDREASDVNVICFAAHHESPRRIESALETFFDTKFEKLPRRIHRLKKLDEPVSVKGKNR